MILTSPRQVGQSVLQNIASLNSTIHHLHSLGRFQSFYSSHKSSNPTQLLTLLTTINAKPFVYPLIYWQC